MARHRSEGQCDSGFGALRIVIPATFCFSADLGSTKTGFSLFDWYSLVRIFQWQTTSSVG